MIFIFKLIKHYPKLHLITNIKLQPNIKICKNTCIYAY